MSRSLSRNRVASSATQGSQSAGQIRHPEQIRCLEVPVRQEILDTVRVLQPCSVSEIAAHLGRTKTSLYHNIRQLLATKLLAEHGMRPTGRRPEMLYFVPHDMRMQYKPSDPANVTSVNRVAEGITRAAARDFQRGLQSELAVTEGVNRNIWAARTKLWLSDADLKEVNRLLDRLTRYMEQENRDDRRLYAMTWVLAAVPPSTDTHD